MVCKKKARISKGNSLFLSCLILFSGYMLSCSKDQKVEKVVNYTGPFIEADNIETLYTDSSVLRIKLRARKQLELQNGNREFPQGVWVEFFDPTGKKTSTLTANSGTYYKDQNNYTVKGNVIIRNIEKHEQLNTEELNWDPDTRKINTDKYVRIETPEQIITGTGLDAVENFSSYKIRNVKAIFSLDEDEE